MNTLKHREDGRAGDQQSDRMKTGWSTKCLGDLCEIELGKTPARANALYWDEKRETGNVWLSIADLLRAEGNVVVDSKEYVSDKAAAICKLVPKGTLLVSFKLTLGRLAFAGRDLFTNEAIAALTIYNERELSKEFLYYALTFFDWVKAAENDVKLKGMTLNKAKLKVLPVSFPPLAEQQRIVAILDEAFEGIATARKHAEQNLQNAKALFESHLQSTFAIQWQTCELTTLANLATDITDGDHLPPPKAPVGIPFITIGNILKDKHEIDFSKSFKVSQTYYDALKPNKKPQKGDVLYTVTGSFGIPVIVRDVQAFCFQRHIGLIRPKTEICSSWLYYLLLSPQVVDQANVGATGTAQRTVSLKLLRSFEVPMASPSQQDYTVRILDALRDETNRLCDIYTQKIAALDALKKSLLHQAFSGEL